MPNLAETGGKRISQNGRRALFVPLLLCLLTILPGFRHGLEWLDCKFSDFLFSFSPYLRAFTGQPKLPQHPTLIINKDATFARRFGRMPNRGDYADLLYRLEKAGAGVVALDFIYDSPGDPEADEKFCKALASTPLPILAHKFISRGSQTFEQLELIDESAARPQQPERLYRPIADAAAATGLINIASDLDATVRFLPVAYHPADSEEFMLTLGYTTWIASLLNEQRSALQTLAKNELNGNPAGILKTIISKAPFIYRSTGHAGVDQATRRLEAILVARLLGQQKPELADAIKKAAKELSIGQLGRHSWLKMPEQPLPFIGSYEIPCLRPFFSKQTPPLKGDGIKTRSLGILLETDADRASPYLDNKLMLDVDEDAVYSFDNTEVSSGTAEVSGSVLFADLSPVSSASVLLLNLSHNSWHATHSDRQGHFKLAGLPAGDFIIYVKKNTSHGWQKGTHKGHLEADSDNILPLLLLPIANESITLSNVTAENGKAVIFGEPLPLLRSDTDGHLSLPHVPQGFEVIGLDENQPVQFIDGNLVLENGEMAAEQIVAVLPEESSWLLRFYSQQNVLASSSELVLNQLPASLDARMAIFSPTSKELPTTADIELLPGASETISDLPPLSRPETKMVEICFAGNDETTPTTIIMLDETGREFRLSSGTPTRIPANRYLVLLENGARRSLWLSRSIDASTVFVGTSLAEDHDFVTTPINFIDRSFNQIPGINLHATLFSALTRNSFLTPVFFHSDRLPITWPLLQFLFLFPLLLLLNQIFVRYGAIQGGIWVTLCSVIWLATGIYLFLEQRLLPLFYPLLQLGSFGAVRGYIAWAIARQQERQTRQTFGRFISAAVVDEILRTPGGLKTGSVKKELTVIFTDLAGFTTISEKLSPEQLTELMNEYLDEMTRILFKFGGTLDKYIGDAIMGFWNHPRPQPDHAQRATECAIAMQVKLAELREKWIKKGLPRVEVRAGINTAVCMVGFIGSEIQMNFTCLGDGVNLASRLEGANKAYGTFTMVSETVHNQIDRQLFSTRFLDYLAVKGKVKPIQVFEVRGYRSDETRAWLEAEPVYQAAVEHYLARDWDEAIKFFQQVRNLCPADGPAAIYIERCQQYKETPPPENWDGSYSLKTK